MCSLLMSLFSHDYIKMEIDLLKYHPCFNLLTCVQYSLSTWFLDGWTSILVDQVILVLLLINTAHFYYHYFI